MKNKYAVAIKNIKTFLNKIGRKDINKENMQIAIFSFFYSYYNQQDDDYLDIYKDTSLIQIIEKIVFAE